MPLSLKGFVVATLFACLLVAESSSANAQVNVEQTFFATPSTGSIGGFSETYNLFSSDTNVLIFGTYFDNGAALGAHTVTGAGVLSSNSNPLNERAILSYHEVVPGTTSVNLGASHGSPASSAGYFVMELSAVDLSGGVDIGSGTMITTSTDDRFVVDATAFNSTITTGDPAAGSIITNPFTYDINAAAGGATVLAGFGIADFAGVQNLGWAQGNTSIGEASFGFAQGVSTINAWDFDGGGNFSVGSNWSTGSAPGSGGSAVFADALTAPNAPGIVSLDVAANLSRLTFTNGNQYTIAGPSALTLSGGAEVVTNSGTHEISASIAGANGLVKLGAGNLLLSGNNTYTGLTDVTTGTLLVSNANSISGNVNVDGQLQFVGDGIGGGFNGSMGGSISGGGGVTLANTLTTETVTFSNASTYSGSTLIDGGTLAVSNAAALGSSDGTIGTGTRVQGEGKLALSGNISLGASEVLVLAARDSNSEAVHLTSSGNNTVAGNLKGEIGGNRYNLESTGGTLTLAGTISAPDSNTRNFVFSGDGNFNVTGVLTDLRSDANGDLPLPASNNASSVTVTKRGTGTLTISTGTALQDDFWQGNTTIEEGTIEVLSNDGTSGELWSPTIEVRSGATLDVDDFTTYSLQVGQTLQGAGTVQSNGTTVRIFDDNNVTPGDSVGTLTITGNAELSNVGGGGGSLNYELGNTTAVGGTENDLIAIGGTLTAVGAPSMDVNVTPVEGSLSAGNYRLISHSGGAINTSGLTPSVVSAVDGSPLTIRQNLAVTSAAGQVNLSVTGSAGSLTWTGSNGQAWDVNTTSNWSASPTFFDLDNVTFNDSAGANDTVDISTTNVTPGSTTFNSASGNTYTVTGSNGIVSSGATSLTGNVNVVLANNGNLLTGPISLGAGTSLQLGDGTTGNSDLRGDVTGSGNLTVASGLHLLRGNNTFTSPVVINGGRLNMDSATALGSATAGTTINAGGTLESNNDAYISNEPLAFNGGQLSVGFGGTPTFAGAIDVQAGGANFRVGEGDPTQATVSSNITGTAGGAVNVETLAGGRMIVTGNLTNNGNLTKTGAGTLEFGPTTTVAAPMIAVDGGVLDTTAQSSFSVQSNQTLTGDTGTVQGNVAAASGSTIRVGAAGLEQKAAFRYVDATFGAGGNTTEFDGTTFTPTGNGTGGNNWTERTVFGNGGSIIQGDNNTANAPTNNSPALKSTIGGLNPGESYTVFVNYWDADSTQWRILADDVYDETQTDGGLRLYDSPNDNVAGAIDGSSPDELQYIAGAQPLTAEGNRLLWGASLGSLVANGSGEVEIFVDESGTADGDDRTWYDGITIGTNTTLPVAAVLTIDGDLTLDAGSTLEIDLGTPDVTDLLAITGELSAGGVLDVTLDGTVASPSLGDVFDILDFDSAVGSFSQLMLPTLAGGLSWDTTSLLTTGELSVIAGSGTPGDFNGDTQVDGADFLAWQRNPAIGNLADWETNYGSGASLELASTAVPEPSALLLILGMAWTYTSGGLRRRH